MLLFKVPRVPRALQVFRALGDNFMHDDDDDDDHDETTTSAGPNT